MKLMNKLALLLAIVLCMTVLLPAVAENTGDTLVATVNGMAVTQADVQAQINSMNSYFSQQGYDVTTDENVAAIKEMAVISAVQLAVMKSKAAEHGYLEMSDEELAAITAEVDAEWEELVNFYAVYFGAEDGADEETMAMARTQAMAVLEGAGYTRDVYLEETLNALWYEKLTADMVQGVEVTDADVEAAYAEMVASDQARYENNVLMFEYATLFMGETSTYTPAGYRGIRHILLNVDTDLMEKYNSLSALLEEQIEAVESGDETAADTENAPVTQADVDEAAAAIIASVQPTIDEIHQKLADGVSFTDLIAEYGNDPGMTQEPEKTEGYYVHIESISWAPAFTKGAFTMSNVGDVSEPVISSFGVHILEYTRDVPSGAAPLTDDLRAVIKEDLIADAESEVLNTQLDLWMTEADIVYAE